MTKTTPPTAEPLAEVGLIDTAAGFSPGETLETVLRAARLASPMVIGPQGRNHVMLPNDFRLHELPDDSILPSRTKQRVTVDDRASLTAYANRFSSPASILLADYDKGEISARLDWHPNNALPAFPAPDADVHSVTLKLRLSEEFQRWGAFEGKLHPQEDFARFLEENSSDIGFPEAATMIELSRDFEATVGQTYKSSVRLENGDRRINFQQDSRPSGEVVIPTKFVLSIPIYNGEEPDDLTCLFRWKANGQGGILLGFQWHRVEYQRRAHFQAIATSAAEETGLPSFIGRQA
jgi:uncharacterized protein YfdQ (DUF2303 family)